LPWPKEPLTRIRRFDEAFLKIIAGKMMKRLSLTILCCFLLSGCVLDPVFDTSNWDAFQKSTAAIKAKLSNDDLRRLDIALRYLAMESTPRINGQPVSTVALTATAANPYIFLARLGPKLNGNTAASVIQNLSIKLGAEISAAEKMLENVEGVLGSVEVGSPSYSWQRTGRGNLEQPVVEFTVRNGGTTPILRAYFKIVLMTPGRSIPWVTQNFVQTFKGGLEPREKQQVTPPVNFGGWNDPQLKYLPNAELKVVVTNVEDANGARMIAVDSDSLELKRKVRAALQ
jgi:hypothetical protein